MKKILLPTDFSNNSLNAIKYALSMHADEPCQFILLNTYHVSVPQLETADVPISASLKEDADQQLADLVSELKSLPHHADSTFSSSSDYGPFISIMEKVEGQENPDLIVMGTQGSSNLEEVFIGSSTIAVIKNLSTPTLCIPSVVDFEGFDRVLFCADCVKIKDFSKLDILKDLARKFSSDIHILNVQDYDKEMITSDEVEQAALLRQHFYEIPNEFKVVEGENISEEIKKFADQNQTQLISLLKRDKSFFENLFNESITKKVGFNSERAFLILHE